MIQIKFKDENVNFPTRWEDLKFYQYVDLFTAQYVSPLEIIAYFLQCDAAEVSAFPMGQITALSDAILFLWEPRPAYDNPAVKRLLEQDFGFLMYGRYADAFGAIEAAKGEYHKCFSEVLACVLLEGEYNYKAARKYAGEIESSNAVMVLTMGEIMVEKILEKNDKLQKALINRDYTPEEEEAGVPGLERWGPLGILNSLANNDLLKIEEFVKMTVNQIHTFIAYRNHVGHVNDKLSKILSNPKK